MDNPAAYFATIPHFPFQQTSAKCPLRILAKNHDFRTCESLANGCESPFANPCESLRNHELRKLAKACETLRNHICEFARKLAKACEIILAKACETLVLLRKHICESLRKYMHFALANPCENTICETLLKVYLLVS